MNPFRLVAIAAASGALLTAAGVRAPAFAAGPEIVAGPAADRSCFVPWTDKTKFFKYPAKKGPYRIALANGYIANTWRIQMIQTAKAYAAQPDVAAKLKEFKVVSTGEDVAAQIAAINNFINSGFDAIVVDAQNPEAFKPVIKRANDAGVVLVAFDNILDTEDAINVDVDQKGLGVYWAKWLDKHLPNGGKILEVRGVCRHCPSTRDRHNGIHETLDKTGKKWDIVEVYRQVGRSDRAESDGGRDCGAEAFRRLHRAGRRHRRRAGDDRRQAAVRAVRRRDRKRLPQVLRQILRPGLEMRLGRHRSGAGRSRDQDRDRRARGRSCRRSIKLPLATAEDPNFKDGENYYADSVRQFLRRQLLPDLQHQFHRAGDHGPDEGEQSRPGRPRRRVCRSGALLLHHCEDRGCDANGGRARRSSRMEGVSKRYGGVRALEKADLAIAAGRIHAILGENGAGKSTLIKILSGVVRPDAGRITLDGARGRLQFARRRQPRRHRLHLPGAVAHSRPLGRRQHRHQQSAAAVRPDRPARAAARSPRRRWRAPARRTSIRWRWSRTCRCRAGRWSRSPRRWRASRASSFSTRRRRR